jgi:hypothetical protein
MANPIAIPGTVVPTGSLTNPGGAQGVQGIQGPTAVSADTGNLATLGSDSKILVPQSSIWSARLRSWNSVGNSTFEVDQRNAGGITTGSGWGSDRWFFAKTGTMTTTVGQNAVAAGVILPGTSFTLTSNFVRVTLTGQETSLAAGDSLQLLHYVEGISFRELQNDVHSIQCLVRSSVAGLSFGIALRDSTSTVSLSKLCTISTANAWTLLSLPNLPLWSSGGTFNNTPGKIGYFLSVTLAAGTTSIPPANDTWQTGNFIGAVGQSNFAASPVNSTFDVAFLQHEPGALCTTPIDCPFTQNYRDSLRYFCKSYAYATKPGTASIEGYETFSAVPGVSANTFRGKTVFPVPMARAPTAALYAYDGTLNAVSYITTAQATGPWAITTPVLISEKGIDYLTGTANYGTTTWLGIFHYTADTGW